MYSVSAWFVLAYVNVMPYLVIVNLIAVAAVLFIVAKVRNPYRRTAKAIAMAFVVVSITWWISVPLFTGVKRDMAFDMVWSYGENSEGHPDPEHIVLSYKSQPNHFIGIYSRDLGKYLETLPSRDVRVVFQVTLDFGSTRGFHEIQIGDLRSWNSHGGYTGSRGLSSEPTPWP